MASDLNYMKNFLKESIFDYITIENKKFIVEFTKQMKEIGFSWDGKIGDGFCWGKNMVIYSKNKKVIARIYIRDDEMKRWGAYDYQFRNELALRLFFSNITKHIDFIEKAPEYVRNIFVNDAGLCHHCGEKCHHRKEYTIGGIDKVQCGNYFIFREPKVEDIKDYISILKEFYIKRRGR
jgi:hypothetical protein